MNKIVKARISKHMRATMRYFWASFALQILVYALLSHVIIKYWYDIFTVIPAVLGILIYIPFTQTLLKKFKAMAIMPMSGNVSPIYGFISNQRDILRSFLTFKKRYELFLIPLSCAIGVLLTFKLYVPGGAYAHPQGVVIVFALSILSCYLAIRDENRKSFTRPLNELDGMLKDFEGS